MTKRNSIVLGVFLAILVMGSIAARYVDATFRNLTVTGTCTGCSSGGVSNPFTSNVSGGGYSLTDLGGVSGASAGLSITGGSATGADSISKMNVNGVVNPLDYGVKCDDVTDDTTAINYAVAAARAYLTSGGASFGGVVKIPQGLTCKFNGTINLLWGVSLDATGSNLDFSGLPSTGVAIQTGFNGPPAARIGGTSYITFGSMSGPGISTTSVGIQLGGLTTSSANTGTNINTRNGVIQGFGIGMQEGSNAFENRFSGLLVTGNGIGYADINGAVDMGSDERFDSVQFSANDKALNIGNGQVYKFDNCGFGDQPALPFVTLYGNRTYQFSNSRWENNGGTGETGGTGIPIFVDIISPNQNLEFINNFFTVASTVVGDPIAWDNSSAGGISFIDSQAQGLATGAWYVQKLGTVAAVNINSPTVTGPSTAVNAAGITDNGLSASPNPLCAPTAGSPITNVGCSGGGGGSGNTPITLSGATPTAVITTGNTFDDFNNLVMSANVTSFTLPGTTTPEAKYLTIVVYQPASGGPYTLPTGSVNSPFTAAGSTTLVNTVPGGCPAIPTAASNAILYKLRYSTTLTQWQILGCQTNPSQAAPANNPTTTTGDLIVNSGGVLVRLAAGAVDTFLQGQGAGVLPAYSSAIASCSGASNALTYNTSTHQFGCNTISSGGITAANNGLYTNGTTVGRTTLQEDATGNFLWRDDFLYQDNTYSNVLVSASGQYLLEGTSCAAGQLEPSVGHFGIWYITTPATASSDCYLIWFARNNADLIPPLSATVPATVEERIDIPSTANSSYAVGLESADSNGSSGVPLLTTAHPKGMWCSVVNTGNWTCFTDDGTTTNTVTLGPAIPAATGYIIWKFVALSGSVVFYASINGAAYVNEGTSSANIFTVYGFVPQFEVESGATAAAETLDVDAVDFIM